MLPQPANDTGDHHVAVRRLNDAFRRTLRGGRVVVTRGILDLGSPAVGEVLRAVAAFDRFEPGNDPYREHDFGSLHHGDVLIFFKIDTYDLDLCGYSPDPADPTVTVRVMTVMRSEEY
jgi:hypothetical protein